MVRIRYLARDPESAQRKIRRGDFRDMERAERDLAKVENAPEREEDHCPEPLPVGGDRGQHEKDESP